MKVDYSEPKIYTGGVDINSWSKLSKKEQKAALAKDWYVYYSYRNPKTGKLTRQTNIKGGANTYKDKRSRLHILKVISKSLTIILEEGFSPYTENQTLEEFLKQREQIKDSKQSLKQLSPKTVIQTNVTQDVIQINKIQNSATDEYNSTIQDSFKLALDLKERVMNSNSFVKYRSRINRFQKWLNSEGIENKTAISAITKKIVIHYLNTVLQESSPRNRNNTRTDIASFFQILEDNDIIKENFVKKINVLKAVPERNKTYKPKQQEDIFNYLDNTDPVLLLFIKFISYNFLRPIEVCRLTIGDIDITDKKLYVRAKNQPVKIKIIPDILLKEIPDLSKFDKDDHLFTSTAIGGKWDIDVANKRDFFTKKFKKIKDHFGLNADYGLYSFRHTFITKLYREMNKTSTTFEVKSKLQLITGHATMKALEQYLRDIDAELPEDYSNLLS